MDKIIKKNICKQRLRLHKVAEYLNIIIHYEKINDIENALHYCDKLLKIDTKNNLVMLYKQTLIQNKIDYGKTMRDFYKEFEPKQKITK